MSTTTTIDPKVEAFLRSFSGNEFENKAISSVLNEARFALNELTFPTRKTEDWKYTRVHPITRKTWETSVPNSSVNTKPYQLSEGHVSVVFVDGLYREDLSNIAHNDYQIDIINTELDNAILQAHFGQLANHKEIFTALNTAHITGGALIHIAKQTTLDRPIHLLHINTQNGVAAFPRHLIVMEENASVEIVASQQSTCSDASYTNMVMEVFVGENSHFHMDHFQAGGNNDLIQTNIHARQQANSLLHINTITQNAAWVRNDISVELCGQNCESNLFGIYTPKDKQHVDNHTSIDHQAPHCNSNELYKGVLYDQSTGVFNGKVFVRQDAQQTNAFQQNANILMCDDATMNSKPELEIYADDVKCSHGSTTGQFDEEAIFYLKARGLQDETARKMLIDAFLEDVLEKVKHSPI